MRARVSKEFRFEAAHHLPLHDGKCARPHGHSYRVVVTCSGPIISTKGSPKFGMVFDFADITTVWNDICKPHLDHQDLNESLLIYTTAENIAVWILTRLRQGRVPVTEVELWETATGSVRVTHGDVINGTSN